MFKRKNSVFFKFLALMLLAVLMQIPGLTSFAISPANDNDAKAKTYIIGLKKTNGLDSFMRKKGLSSGKCEKAKNSNILIADLNESELNSLKNDSSVAFLEQDSPVEILSTGQINKRSHDVAEMKVQAQTIPWGIKEIGVEKAIENRVVGKKTKIAILDTGISGHKDIEVVDGVSFVEGISDYSDDNGHGTHVAGTIAAVNNRIGIVGGASASAIYSVKVLDKNGAGTYSQVIQGIEWAIENNVNIITMSLGGSVDSEALREIIKAASVKGILIVAAAGNSGAEGEGIAYPAAYPEVISVGAIDRNRHRATFSSTGTELDIVAPGVEILSTTSDGDYGILSGTSVATPHVTGAAAALWSTNRSMTNEEIRKILFNSALPLGAADQYGYGMVSLSRALGFEDEQADLSLDDKIAPQSEKGLPFEFMNSVISGKSVSTSFRLKKNEDKYEGIYLSVNEVGKKEPICTKELKAFNDVLSVDGLEPGKKYIFNLVINEKGNIVESYTGDLILNAKKSKDGSKYDQAEARIGAVEGSTIDLDALGVTETGADTVSIMTGTRYESEYNDVYNYANTIYDDDDVYGTISNSTDVDWYRVQFSSNGNANFWLGNIPSGTDYDLYIYDSNINPLVSSANGSNNGELISQFPVSAGSWYYIKVIGYNGTYNASSYYLLRAKNYPTQPSGDWYESNDSMGSATSIGNNATISDANIHTTSDVDYFRFTISSRSSANIGLSNIPSGTDYDMTLSNSSGSQIGGSYAGSNDPESIPATLDPGTYYIKVYSYSGSSSSYYRLQVTSTVISSADRYESNDSMSSATSIGNNATISDTNIHATTDLDYFRFTLIARSNVTVGLNNIPSGTDYDMTLSNSSGSQIGGSYAGSNNPESFSAALDAGTYYIKVYSYSGSSSSNYSVQVSSTPIINTVVEDYYIESDHPYNDNYNGTWTIARAGATRIRVHFESIETENGWDYIRTSAGNEWSGSYTDVWSNWVTGDSIDVTLTTDGSVVMNGFVIDRIEYEPGTGSAGGGHDGVDAEPNNEMSEAESISWADYGAGNSWRVGATGYIGSSTDVDWYKVYLVPGNYSFTLTNNNVSRTSIYGLLPADYNVYIRNSEGTSQINGLNPGTATEQKKLWIATAGTYYIEIDGAAGAYSTSTKYKFLLVKGDAGFLMEAHRYQQFPHSFYGRQRASIGAALGTEHHYSGVAYSFGIKDTISNYESKMNAADVNKTTPQDNWNDYNGYPKPGIFDTEYNPNTTNQSDWAGVDCSGLIWRCAAASITNYAIENSSILDMGTEAINNNSTDITDYHNARIGDIYVKSGSHVVLISKLATRESFFKILHARSSTYSRVVQETGIDAIDTKKDDNNPASGYRRKSLNQ